VRSKRVAETIYIYIYNTLKHLYVFLLFITIDYKRYVNLLEKSERDEGTEAKKEKTKWGDN